MSVWQKQFVFGTTVTPFRVETCCSCDILIVELYIVHFVGAVLHKNRDVSNISVHNCMYSTLSAVNFVLL
jgi:hypothetical protein